MQVSKANPVATVNTEPCMTDIGTIQCHPGTRTATIDYIPYVINLIYYSDPYAGHMNGFVA